MQLVSYTFFVFLGLVVLGRWVLPRRTVPAWLLGASAVFLAGIDLGAAGLLLAYILVGWLTGLAVERWPERRRLLSGSGIAAGLAGLAAFKAAGFLAAEGWVLTGPARHQPVMDLLLPLGLSYYTFSLVAYLARLGQGRPAERSLIHLGLHLAFFPKLVAGPIVRPGELLPQLHDPAPFDPDGFARGMFLISRGLVKTSVFSAGLAAWVDPVFSNPGVHSGFGVWAAVLGFTAQIYCDFSGYTDLARGTARLLGFVLPENFALPYLATSPQAFWRRWHMSLSRFLRDLLYIPLGGNRRGRVRTWLNLVIVMALGGAWHGTHLRYLFWGVFHGLVLWFHRVFDSLLPLKSRGGFRKSMAFRPVAWLATFTAVMLGWILFRADKLEVAWSVMGRMASLPAHGPTPAPMLQALILTGLVALGHALGPERLGSRLHARLPAVLQGVVWAGALLVIYVFGSAPGSFIYANY